MCDRADYEHTLRCTYAERDQLKERLKRLEEELDKRAQIAVNAINRAEKAETRVGQLDTQLQLMVGVCEKLEARIKELEGERTLSREACERYARERNDALARIKELEEQSPAVKEVVAKFEAGLAFRRRAETAEARIKELEAENAALKHHLPDTIRRTLAASEKEKS
jgi:chromosome segregation ATPase